MNNNYILYFVIGLFLIFFTILIYYLFNGSKLLKFRVISTPIDNSMSNEKFNEIKNRTHTCNDKCTKEFCCEYHNQKIKYDLCKECSKENKCYDIGSGDCVPCRNNYTCEQLYGCGDMGPIEPIKNYCTRCWLKS
jgi:hypothetical protein